MTQLGSATLPDGVVREAAAPESLVVVWTLRPLPVLLGTLAGDGHLVVTVDPAETEVFIESSGAPAALLVDADVLDAASAQVLARVRRAAPATRVCVLAGAGSSPTGVLHALRAGVTETIDLDDPGHDDALAQLMAARPGVERVLAVGAHPDDVEIGCGATLLTHRSQGHSVSVLTLSRGNVGGDHEVRRREAVNASLAMSSELLMADLPDTRLEDVPEMIGLIEGVIATVAPTTVYVHSSSDTHQDHRAVHEATVIAARRTRQLFCYQSPSSTNDFAPTRFVPVDTTIDDKIDVLAAYRSQAARHYLQPDLVKATARYWSRQLPHALHAEPFEVVRASEAS